MDNRNICIDKTNKNWVGLAIMKWFNKARTINLDTVESCIVAYIIEGKASNEELYALPFKEEQIDKALESLTEKGLLKEYDE